MYPAEAIETCHQCGGRARTLFMLLNRDTCRWNGRRWSHRRRARIDARSAFASPSGAWLSALLRSLLHRLLRGLLSSLLGVLVIIRIRGLRRYAASVLGFGAVGIAPLSFFGFERC